MYPVSFTIEQHTNRVLYLNTPPRIGETLVTGERAYWLHTALTGRHDGEQRWSISLARYARSHIERQGWLDIQLIVRQWGHFIRPSFDRTELYDIDTGLLLQQTWQIVRPQ